MVRSEEMERLHLILKNLILQAAKETEKYLDSLAGHFRKLRKNAGERRDSVSRSIEAKIGKEELMKLKEQL